ncbi:MAG: anthranilate phosphoribosyltransferase [Pseudomonadales bacterium]|nr:anthranilate phosphoribosyltransferase [Gammaproteobacteria bacterium]MBK9666492.1 anthranilate phosphoribosyltransferase [Gammaproteobacteria bacterium]MBP6052815.1 anthranilate phosphoribosyltransferase [Pseudomonadales bacterium]MBP6228451.1 anthranilate phosphoribosyltransferase [Pseudomonadales bacterium]
MDIRQALERIVAHIDLERAEMREVMHDVMSGGCTDAQIGALLLGLRMKGESIDEITAAAEVMRELATPVVVDVEPLVDVVGTGGDGANLFNISTAAAFVVAAAGAHVAKHGNRGVSSASGSADVLEHLGVKIGLPAAVVARGIRELRVGFMFAPAHHGAMRHAIGPRRELGLRTLFNILGPLTNPAAARRMLVGTFSRELCRPMAKVLGELGAEHVLVVHAEDGLDEISLATRTHVVELRGGVISEQTVTPEQLGIASQSLIGLEVGSAVESAALIRDALGKRRGAHAAKAADIIALNAGAAIYVSGVATSMRAGVAVAHDLIYAGLALERIEALASFCECLEA